MANMLLEGQLTTNQMDTIWDVEPQNGNSCMVKTILIVEDNAAL